jgi:hypothetical protein
VSDAGLEHLASLPKLRMQERAETDPVVKGVTDPRGLPAVPGINLSDTAITDAGLRHLAGLVGLGRLLVRNTAVSDAGLHHLRSLKGLRVLDLQDTKVTDEGVAALSRAVRDLKISR